MGNSVIGYKRKQKWNLWTKPQRCNLFFIYCKPFYGLQLIFPLWWYCTIVCVRNAVFVASLNLHIIKLGSLCYGGFVIVRKKKWDYYENLLQIITVIKCLQFFLLGNIVRYKQIIKNSFSHKIMWPCILLSLFRDPNWPYLMIFQIDTFLYTYTGYIEMAPKL